MDKVLTTIINAVGALPTQGIKFLLDRFEEYVTQSTIQVDNTAFYKVIAGIKAWEPKKNG